MADENILVRLTKLMGMSTSSNDGEALTAVRMANRELANLGKSWDDLLKGKITIIADPFQNLSAPPTTGRSSPPPMARPTRPKPPRTAGLYTAPPPPPGWTQAPPRPSPPNYAGYAPSPPPPPPPPKDRQNFYGGNCVACSNYVGAKQGFIKKDNIRGWNVYCDPCFKSNAQPTVRNTANIGSLA